MEAHQDLKDLLESEVSMLRPKQLRWIEIESGYWEAATALATYCVRRCCGWRKFLPDDICKDVSSNKAAKEACQNHYNSAWVAGGEEVSDWGPIETAPKDCTIIGGVASDEMKQIVYEVKWDKNEQEWRDCDGWAYNLTHWMPLYELPESNNR